MLRVWPKMQQANQPLPSALATAAVRQAPWQPLQKGPISVLSLSLVNP